MDPSIVRFRSQCPVRIVNPSPIQELGTSTPRILVENHRPRSCRPGHDHRAGSAGNATAVVAPGGQRTTLTIEANGHLAAITNPAGETVELTYSADGLPVRLKDGK